MKYIAIIKIAYPFDCGEVHIACVNRHEAVIKARKECLKARAIGIECYGRVLMVEKK